MWNMLQVQGGARKKMNHINVTVNFLIFNTVLILFQ